MTADDAWAIKAAADSTAVEWTQPADGLGGIERPRGEQARRALWPVAAGCFILAGAGNAAYQLVPSKQGITGWDFPSEDAFFAVRALLFIVTGALLTARRTWMLGAGLALSSALVMAARYFPGLRPWVISTYGSDARLWTSLAAFAVGTVGGAVALAAVAGGPHEAAPPRRTERRTGRILGLVGLAGAVGWGVSGTVNWLRTTYDESFSGTHDSVTCCTWSQTDTLSQATLVISTATLLALAVAAAVVRSTGLSAGLLIGGALVLLSEVVEVVVEMILPKQSMYGFHPSLPDSSLTMQISPLTGFWFAPAGLTALIAAGVLRLMLTTRRAPYAAQPFAAPGGPAPAA
jgi:hypothetical protein